MADKGPHPWRAPQLGQMLRTVVLLTPRQVVSRPLLRTWRAAIGAAPGVAARVLSHPASSSKGWPETFEPIDGRLAEGFPTAEANARGEFCFLDEPRGLGDPPEWAAPGATRLWRFNLHYFTWAWSFRSHPDREWARWEFERLWRSWTTNVTFGRGDAWAPYPVSLRAWALCGIYRDLVANGPLESQVVDALRRHAGYLRTNVEHDIGGNHVLKNLKALVGLGLFLSNARLEERSTRSLIEQLASQVLPDGGHFELSPSYHCQVLGDLLDVRDLLAAAGREAQPTLESAIGRMRAWLGAMLLPDGDVPLFNDGTLVGSRLLALLRPHPPPTDRLIVLPDSGYVVLRPGPRLHVVMDVGDPCPRELPAHAHADCLSFVLAVDGIRVLVDGGTSTYDPGPIRSYERSTAAHNTVTIDGEDQTELWGAFRAGRRAQPCVDQVRDDGDIIIVVASHDGYHHLSGRPVHRRTIRANGRSIEILDEILGEGAHDLVARSHFAPGVECSQLPGDGLRAGPLLIQTTTVGPAVSSAQRLVSGWCAEQFGRRRSASVFEVEAHGQLPLGLRTTVQAGNSTETVHA